MSINSLKEVINFNKNFKTSINLYLNLNNREKIDAYIPTKSSIKIINDFVSSILRDKEQATLLIGPYGKGKSHLLLVLLAVISLERNDENTKLIERLVDKIANCDSFGMEVAQNILNLWNHKKRYLPIILNNTHKDLDQAFLIALNDALKREGLNNITPDTYYSIAVEKIESWEKDYPETYMNFSKEIGKRNFSVADMKTQLLRFYPSALKTFQEVFPLVTSGSEFNPLVASGVLAIYKGISEKLVDEYNYEGVYIVFDEFSKFIEGQNRFATGQNMELIQEICELATESSASSVRITMVAHKSIKEYGAYISQEVINSFTGIEGRLIEKFFVTSSKNNYELIKNAIIKDEDRLADIPDYEKLLGTAAINKFYQIPIFKSDFTLDDFEKTVLRGCYPLSPVAVYLLLNISEKVAQNERTLFTFISNDEPHSMARFVREHFNNERWLVGADLIYDYFSTQFKKDTSNEMVHNIWLAAEYALSKCSSFDERVVIKTLAILLIVNKEEEIPADVKYLPLAANLENAEDIIDGLMDNGLIYKKKSTDCYAFRTKAGSELKNEIKKAREIKGEYVNYANVLREITGKYFVIPRRYNATNCITRYFRHEFMDIETFLSINSSHAFFDDKDNSDGKVITLYGFSEICKEHIRQHFNRLGCKNLVVVIPNEPLTIRKQLRDYEILQDIKKNHIFSDDNMILNKEIPLLEEDISSLVENKLSELYFEHQSCEVVYYDNDATKIMSGDVAEKAVNECCNNLFYASPVINNELINRSVINTAQTRKSRLSIIKAIISKTDDELFYSGTGQEATIYRSLFCQTGVIEGKADEKLNRILSIMDSFLDSCCDEKKCFSDLINILQMPPYSIRNGIVSIYFAYVLAKRSEDVIIYFNNREVQVNENILVDMSASPSEFCLFVSRDDYEKEKYISNLNALFNVSNSRNLSDNRIKDIFVCMQRWYRALPQVTRNSVCLEKYVDNIDLKNNMLLLKKYLQKVDCNPFEILFSILPKEFGSSDLDGVFDSIRECIYAYDGYFNWIQECIVDTIYDVFDEKKKHPLFNTLKEWYEAQSAISKQGLHSGHITRFMSCMENLNAYDDYEVAQRIAKATTDVYIENWNNKTIESFKFELCTIKSSIESIKDSVSEGKLKLTFTDKTGKLVDRYYNRVDENTGSILRNIIEDTLDEFDDLSVNDRVAILLEMIEKVIG